jgi:hypothetical protein
MEWTGACLCGAVRYRATADPIRAGNCHCGMCRRTSGAVFLTPVHFPIGAFTWVQGKPLLLLRAPEPSQAGHHGVTDRGLVASRKARQRARARSLSY